MSPRDIKDDPNDKILFFNQDGTAARAEVPRRHVIEPARRGEFHITADVSDYWIDFVCRKAISWTPPDCRGWSRPNAPLYEKKDEMKEPFGGSPPTENPDEAFVHMTGFLKFDGCMEIYREEVHTCCSEHIEEEYQCIRRIHLLAAEAMGHWEGDVPRDLETSPRRDDSPSPPPSSSSCS